MKNKLLNFVFGLFALFAFQITFIPTFALQGLTVFNYDSERILNYNTEITVNSDSSLDVKEQITVVALNIDINRGIFRDYPTRYSNEFGVKKRVGFEIKEIKKAFLGSNFTGNSNVNLKEEPYHIEELQNGTRIYVGEEDVILPKGIYQYEIHYKTTYQLNNLENADELYYNITGNGWQFPIDHASTEIILPAKFDSDKIGIKLYQGPQGSTEESSKFKIEEREGKTVISAEADRKLNSEEGFTVRLEFPKGKINYPFDHDGDVRILKDNFDYVILSAGLLFALILYILLWRKYGIDPVSRTVIPRFEPPKDFSPAGVSYLNEKKFNNKAFAASVVNLGVKGYLKITEKEEGALIFKSKYYILEKLKDADSSLPEEEKLILESLFSSSDVYELKPQYDSSFATLISSFQNKVKSKYFDPNYNQNIWQSLLGLIFTIGVYLVAGVFASDFENYLFPLLIGLFVAAVLSSLIYILLKNKNYFLKLVILAVVSLISVIFLVINYFISVFGFWPSVFILFSSLMYGAFLTLIARPTEEGIRRMEEIEGFKMYLEAAEVPDIEIINREHPKTLDLFQKYLPFAIALGVDTVWTKQFEDQIKRAQELGDTHFAGWYVGTSAFSTDSFNSIASTIGSTVTSSSSSSGGGSSGGGGGGGGGGGW